MGVGQWAGGQAGVNERHRAAGIALWCCVIQCYTVGKSRGSITGPRHSDGLLGLRHEPGELKTRDSAVCKRPVLVMQDTDIVSAEYERIARKWIGTCCASTCCSVAT